MDDVAAIVAVAGHQTEPFAGLFGFAQFLFETVVVDNGRRWRANRIYYSIHSISHSEIHSVQFCWMDYWNYHSVGGYWQRFGRYGFGLSGRSLALRRKKFQSKNEIVDQVD